MNNINYQKELDKVISEIKSRDDKPRLLLHSCCAPCSSYCLVYLREYFDITCFFYNPNITDVVEYFKRLSELERLASELNRETGVNLSTNGSRSEKAMDISSIKVIDGGYKQEEFFNAVKGFEKEPEGGLRCRECFALRLKKTYEAAKSGHFDYFTTTLTISPLKNAAVINEIGQSLVCGSISAEADVNDKNDFGGTPMWLPSDFKKKGGYQRSIELSREYNLYRQNYCGCCFSIRDIADNGDAIENSNLGDK